MKNVIVIVCFGLMLSCQSKVETPKIIEPTPAVKAMGEKVMNLHDMAMERMTEIRKLKTQLEGKAEAKDIVEALDKADEGMFDWMHGYKMDSMKQDEPKALKYLNSELVKVTKVKNDIDGSITAANQYLSKHE